MNLSRLRKFSGLARYHLVFFFFDLWNPKSVFFRGRTPENPDNSEKIPNYRSFPDSTERNAHRNWILQIKIPTKIRGKKFSMRFKEYWFVYYVY